MHSFIIVTTAPDIESISKTHCSYSMAVEAVAIFDVVNYKWIKNRWGNNGSLYHVTAQFREHYMAAEHLKTMAQPNFWITG